MFILGLTGEHPRAVGQTEIFLLDPSRAFIRVSSSAPSAECIKYDCISIGKGSGRLHAFMIIRLPPDDGIEPVYHILAL